MLGTKHLTRGTFSNGSETALGGKGGQWQDEIQQDRVWSITVAENRNSVLYNQKCWSFHDFELKCPSPGQIVLPETVGFQRLVVASVLLEPSRVNGNYLS